MRWILLLLTLSLTACGGGQAVAPVGSYGYDSSKRSTSKASTSTPSSYTVRKGDTLYSISWRFGMDYKELARINGIRSPYTIFAGQKLRFKPSAGSRTVASKPKTSTTKSSKQTTSKTTTTKKSTTKPKSSPEPAFTGSQHLKWRWPTEGKVISTYSNSSPGRKGIDIAGRSGQSVVAAASGKVVYSGNGLPRYGNLLIIKHNDVYLSAYAHNKTLLVKEGQIVKSGQKIATLGRTGTQQDQLHFEIRRNGKPLDPMRFLPKR